MGNFVHLHLHSEYSLLDGAVRLTQQVFKRDDEGKPKIIHLMRGQVFNIEGKNYTVDIVDGIATMDYTFSTLGYNNVTAPKNN